MLDRRESRALSTDQPISCPLTPTSLDPCRIDSSPSASPSSGRDSPDDFSSEGKPPVTLKDNCLPSLALPVSSLCVHCSSCGHAVSVPSFNEGTAKDASFSGMKRESDMEGEAPYKRPRHSGDTELRLLMQSKAAGSIIGKGGINISRLRSENAACITIPDCPGPERVLSVVASEDVVVKVLAEILSSLDEASHTEHEVDIRMLVHQSQAGCVIGKGGSKVKELRERCGGQIKVYGNTCPQSTDRIVQILGGRHRSVDCVQHILQLLKDSPVKGINNPYNPQNFDEFYAGEYGGWGDGSSNKGGGRFGGGGDMGRQMGRGPPMGPGPMGRGPPMGGPHGGGPPMGGPIPYGRRGMMGSPPGGMMGRGPPMNGNNFSSMRQHKEGGRHFSNGGRGGSPPPHDHHSGGGPAQVTIPIAKDMVGAIIGKGGARIRKIRSDSGATITIEDSRPNSEERSVTICGTDFQVGEAKYLIEQSMREHSGPPPFLGRRSF